MAFLFLVGASVAYWAEARGNPELASVDQAAERAGKSGGNMEGKEVRFGIATRRFFCDRDHGRELWSRQQHGMTPSRRWAE